MNKYLKIGLRVVLLILIVAGVSGIFILKPATWVPSAVSYLEEHSDYKIDIGNINGHLLTSTNIADIRIVKPDSSLQLYLPELTLSINPIPWLYGDFSFRKLHADNYYLIIQADTGKSLPLPTDSFTSANHDLYVRDLRLTGRVKIDGQPAMKYYSTIFSGRFRYRPNGSFIYARYCEVNDQDRNKLKLKKSGVQVFPDELVIREMDGEINDVKFNLTANYNYETPVLKGQADFKNLPLPASIRQSKLIAGNWQKFDASINLTTDFADIQGEFTINNGERRLAGELQATRTDQYINLEEVIINSGEGQLKGNGVWENDGRLNGRVALENFSFNNLIRSAPRSALSGLVLVEGNLLKQNIWASFDLVAEGLFAEKTITGSGSVLYSNGTISTDNPIDINMGLTSANIAGNYQPSSGLFSIDMELLDGDLSELNSVYDLDFAGGWCEGTLHASGKPDSLAIAGEAQLSGIDYRGVTIGTSGIHGNFMRQNEQINGAFSLDLDSASWRDYRAVDGTAEIQLHDDTVKVASVHLKDGDNFLQLAGTVVPQNSIVVNQLRLGHNLHYFVNAHPIRLNRSAGGYRIAPFTIHIDDGMLEGFANLGEYREGRLKFSNFDSHALLEHIPGGFLGIEGLLFGEIAVYGPVRDETIEIELSLKNGEIIQQDFDDLVISSVLHDSILHIDEFTLIHGEDVGIQLTGVLPIKEKISQTIPIELFSELRRVDFAVLRQFMPNFTYLGGKISGEIDLNGTTSDTRFQYDLEIEDAIYDIIPLGMVTGHGYYADNRIDLTSFASHRGPNVILGSGSLPVDFDISSQKFGKMIEEDSLRVDITGNTNDLVFLSNYLGVTDSLTGDFDINLSLSGVPEKIIRDGWLRVNGGKIYTVLLDNIVEDVDADLSIVNNHLTVGYFQGRLNPSDEYYRRFSLRTALTGADPRQRQNIYIAGGMDLTRFFRPRFDLEITAEDAYIRTLLGDIDGIIEARLTMTGRDTITYSGTITPVNVEMKKEFAVAEIDESPPEPGSITNVYKLTFPITGAFKLINTQMDADLAGELSMSQFGEEEADYAGELQIRDGKFYSAGVVYSIDEGSSMQFSGQGFNPEMSINAYTNIDIYMINISLAGRLDNPTWIFESNPYLSQTDILGLLTVGQPIENYDWNMQNIGQMGQNVVTAWFETQLEKNISQRTREMGLIDEVDFSTTSTVINETGQTEDVTTITAQRQVSSKLAVNYSYRRSFSLTNANQQLVGVEYKLNRYLSLVGNYDDEGKLQVKYRLRYTY